MISSLLVTAVLISDDLFMARPATAPGNGNIPRDCPGAGIELPLIATLIAMVEIYKLYLDESGWQGRRLFITDHSP